MTGTRQLRISVDREAIARFGLNVQDVQSVIGTAVGGETVGQVFEGVARFDITVRYPAENRRRKEDIADILVAGPGKLRVPLAQLALIEEVSGPMQITRENGQRFTKVMCNVRGRDIGSFVADASRAVEKNVILPAGYFITWGGQFQLQQEANSRLMLVIPITLLLVFVLLYASFRQPAQGVADPVQPSAGAGGRGGGPVAYGREFFRAGLGGIYRPVRDCAGERDGDGGQYRQPRQGWYGD